MKAPKIKTVKAEKLSIMAMSCGNAKKYPVVIHNGKRKRWVGIGWVDEGLARHSDVRKYPTVRG